MSASSKGSARERQVRKHLEAEGRVVVRSAASASPVDLWAMENATKEVPFNDGDLQYANLWAIQVKANAGNAYKNFQPAERQALASLAAQAGATPYLVHWPPRGECRWYAESDWPK